MPDTILVSELFGPTVQGEGALTGQLSHFLRTSGCGYRCTWCDSLHAVDPVEIKKLSRRMTIEEILEAIHKLGWIPPWITLTGGDPVAWDLTELVHALKLNFKVAVETQGALWQDWLEYCDLVTCSPKPPSSGMSRFLDIALLQKYAVRLNSKLVFKIVAFDEVDLDFAERIHRVLPKIPMYLSSGTLQSKATGVAVKLQVIEGYKELADAVLRRPALFNTTIGPQMHVLLWGRDLGR